MTLTLTLFGLAGVLLFLGQHPFVTYPLSLAVLAVLRTRPVLAHEMPGAHVALCLCAYNERGIIAAKVENMLAMRAAIPGLEILVYVDGATDGTDVALAAYGSEIRVVVGQARSGKTHGMNLLVSMTHADFVVFSDANVMFEADAIPRLLRPFADPDVGCVCGHLIYTGTNGSGTAAAGGLYWRLEERIKSLESLTGSVMGADGSIFAIRRVMHRPPPSDIIDDFAVSLSILCDGYRIVKAPDALAYEPLVSRAEEEFRRKIRIGCQAFNAHCFLRARLARLRLLDRYKYVSHKLLRWLTAFSLAVGLLGLTAALAHAQAWVLLGLLAGAGALGLTMATLRPSGLARRVFHICLAFLATGIGVWQSLRGERFRTWSPPASARQDEVVHG